MDRSPAKIGPYRIVRQLGEGGMGVVFEAVHDAIERRVAIKVLHAQYASQAEFAARFFNEARAVNRIAHPGLVQVSDHGQQSDGSTYIVMEYLEGESLAARLKRRGSKLPIHEAVYVGRQLADSLAAAHAKGIVHRDLKPQNVMLVPDPQMPAGERTKLLDFGIAKVTEIEAATGVRTKTNQLMGTPLYMSPEQCEGAGNVDAKSDVYALGVMLFEMLAGRPPFVAEGAGKLLGMHILVAPPLLSELAPEVPAPLAALVQRLLIKDRLARPTMREVADALAQAAEPHPLPKGGAEGIATQSAPLVAGTVRMEQSGTSTLGWSAAQALVHGPGLPRVGVVLGGGGVLLAALLGLALVRRSGGEDRHPAATQAQPASIRWRVTSVPSGAELTRLPDGEVLGRTPWQTTRPAGRGAVRLRVHLDGHQDQEVSLSDEISTELQVVLLPSEPPPARPAVRESTEHAPSASSGASRGVARPPHAQRLRPIYVKPPLEK